MSEEGGVTSSEVTRRGCPDAGNTGIRRRGSGHSAVLSTPYGIQTQSWEQCGKESRNEGASKLCRQGVYVSQHLSFGLRGKACAQ